MRPRPAMAAAWLYGLGDRVIVQLAEQGQASGRTPRRGPGVATELLDKFQAASGGPTRAKLEPYMRSMTCPECQGARLNPRAGRSGSAARRWWSSGRCRSAGCPVLRRPGGAPAADLAADEPPQPLDPLSRTIAEELLKEIRGRLGFLTNVGLHYLTLDRLRRRSRAARPSGSAWPARSARGWSACSISSTSPRSASTRDNDRLIATLSGSATSATR